MLTALWFLVEHLAALVVVGASALALGALLTGSLQFSGSLERSAFRAAIGLGVLANAVHLLGLVGAIRPVAVWLLIAAPILLAFAQRRRGGNPDSPRDDLGPGLLMVLLLGLAPAALLALYPPTAFDATLYHLPFAKAFSTLHATAFLPTLRFPVFPQLVEMLYAAALSVSDDITAQLVHFLCLVLTAVALVAWGRRIATARAGAWAAAAWLGSPIVVGIGATAYVDIGLALFSTLCLYAWSVWRESGQSRWLDASAALAGFAASTKYHGLVFVAAIPIALLTAGPRPRLKACLRYIAIALLALLPFYARIVAETGNPVFPYFSGWFGQNAWSESIDPVSAQGGLAWLDRLTPRHAARVFKEVFLPGDTSPRRATLSPFLLLLPPLLLGAAITDRRRRPLCAVLLAYGACCYLLTPSGRFLFPVLPAGLLVGAAYADEVLRRRKIPRTVSERVFASAIAFALVLPGAAFGWRRVWRQGALPVTREARESYLDEKVRVHAALRSLNKTLGDSYTVYCFHCESAAYYADGTFLGDHFGPYSFDHIESAMEDARSLHAALRQMGVTHLLVNQARRLEPLRNDPAFANLFTPLPAPPGVALYTLQ